MESNAVSAPDDTTHAARHNAAHNLSRTRTMSDEAADAADKLAELGPYLADWQTSMGALRTAPAGDEAEAELRRLTRVAGIVGALVTEARAHTQEAMRINQQRGD